MNKLIDDSEEKPEELSKREKFVNDLADFRDSIENVLAEFVNRLTRTLKQHRDLAGVNGLAHENATIKLANRIKQEMLLEKLEEVTGLPTPEKTDGEGKEENEL